MIRGYPHFWKPPKKKLKLRELPEGTHTKSVESPSFPKETCLQMVGFHTSMLVYQMDLYRCYLIISHSYLASLTDVPFFFGIRIGLRKLLSIPFADFNCDRSGVRLWSPKVEPGTVIFVHGMGLSHFVDHSLEQNPPTNMDVGMPRITSYYFYFQWSLHLFLFFPLVSAFPLPDWLASARPHGTFVSAQHLGVWAHLAPR